MGVGSSFSNPFLRCRDLLLELVALWLCVSRDQTWSQICETWQDEDAADQAAPAEGHPRKDTPVVKQGQV